MCIIYFYQCFKEVLLLITKFGVRYIEVLHENKRRERKRISPAVHWSAINLLPEKKEVVLYLFKNKVCFLICIKKKNIF